MATALQNVSQDIRKTDAFKRAGQILFSNQALNLNPTAIASILNQAGIPVSKNTRISLDVAQMVMSGGAFAKDVETSQSISSFLLPSASAIQAAQDLLNQIGWMKPESPASQIITLGSDVALVAAGSGYNVLSDVKLIIDIAQISAMGQNIADAVAQSNLRDMIIGRKQQFSLNLANNYRDYLNGKQTTFDLIWDVATGSPDYFSTIFPQYGYFLPDTWVMLYAEGSHSDAFGTHNSNAQTWIKTLETRDPETVATLIYQNLVRPNLYQFVLLNQTLKAKNLISLKSLAVLSLLPPYVNIFPDNFNALSLMKTLNLTPYDLNENFTDNFLKNKSQTTQGLITLNGVDYVNTSQTPKIKMTASLNRIISKDKRGDILGLLNEPNVSKDLNYWSTPDWSGGATPLNVTKTSNGKPIMQKLTSIGMTTMNVRCMRNFWSALDILNKFKQSQNFNFISIQNEFNQFCQNLPSYNEIDSLTQKCFSKMTARKQNAIAINNIASFFNTKPSRLKFNINSNGGPITVSVQ